jgi:hypothetical protein
LATAKFGGILFEITPFGNPHRLTAFDGMSFSEVTGGRAPENTSPGGSELKKSS